MKKPDEIKRGLEYLATTDVTLKVKLAKRGLPYAYAEDVASDALAYIRELEAKIPNWISVKERLPERGYKVLTVNGHGYIRIFALWKKTEREWCWIDDAGHFNHVNDITHWMEMPELLEEEA